MKYIFNYLSTFNFQFSTPSGFTFIELILVVTLILVLGTLGTSLGARFITQNGVSNTTDQIIGDLRKAQMNAMMGKQNSNWGVNYSSNSIVLYKGNSYATRTAGFDETFSVGPSVNIACSSGSCDVNFARVTGFPNSTRTFTITGSGETKTVIVNGQGVGTR